MIKKIIAIIFIAVNVFLWCGVYEDDEFSDNWLFFKVRPCPQWYFHSPVGMGDYDSSRALAFSKEKMFDEFMFQQYFEVGGIQSKAFSLEFCDMSESSMYRFWDYKLNEALNRKR